MRGFLDLVGLQGYEYRWPAMAYKFEGDVKWSVPLNSNLVYMSCLPKLKFSLAAPTLRSPAVTMYYQRIDRKFKRFIDQCLSFGDN